MNYTLVLTAALGALDDSAVTIASEHAGVPPHWLSPGTACEFRLARQVALADLRADLTNARVDANLVPSEHRRKWLLVADMDSTIIGCECIDELADFAGVKPQITSITERAMRGEIEFEASLRERVALLKGLDVSVLQRVYDERVRLNEGARVLVRTMSENGAGTLLISGGFSFFASRVAKAAGFATYRANNLLVENGKLTGEVGQPILGREAKREALMVADAEQNIPVVETLAIGDGANDLEMIRAAGLGVAYRAKPVVTEAADARLDHSDLTAALYLQGYRETDLVLD